MASDHVKTEGGRKGIGPSQPFWDAGGEDKGRQGMTEDSRQARPTSLNFTCITEGERKGNGRGTEGMCVVPVTDV